MISVTITEFYDGVQVQDESTEEVVISEPVSEMVLINQNQSHTVQIDSEILA